VCRYVFCEVGLLSGLVRRSRVSVGTCSARADYCRDLLVEVGILSECVRRGRLIVGTCPAK